MKQLFFLFWIFTQRERFLYYNVIHYRLRAIYLRKSNKNIIEYCFKYEFVLLTRNKMNEDLFTCKKSFTSDTLESERQLSNFTGTLPHGLATTDYSCRCELHSMKRFCCHNKNDLDTRKNSLR